MNTFVTLYQNKKPNGIIILASWLIFASTYIIIGQTGDKINYSTGILSFIGQVTLDAIAFIFSFLLYKRSTCLSTKKLFALFAISFSCAILADSSYNIIFNILHIPQTSGLYNSIWEVPFLGFLIFQGLAWYNFILFFNRPKISQGSVVACVTLSTLSMIIIYVFFFQIHWQVADYPIISFYHVADTIIEVVSIIAVFICLMISRNSSLSIMAIGYLTIIASDLIIRYDVIIQKMNYGSYFETTWILGLLLFIYAQAQLLYQKDFKNFSRLNVSYNTVHFKIALGGFSIGILSILLFFILLYILSPMEPMFSEQALKNIPSFLIIYSVLSIVMSHLFAARISFRFKVIEKLITSFMQSKQVVLSEKYKKKVQDTIEFSQLCCATSKGGDYVRIIHNFV